MKVRATILLLGRNFVWVRPSILRFFRAEIASYEGTRYAEREGKYHATVTDYYFKQLTKLMENIRYRDFQKTYGPASVDEGLVITSVADGASRKTVTAHGSHGPIELWTIEMAIAGAVSVIDWQKGR